MDWPSLSVIIPSYNQGAYIERTLLSILKQEYPGPLQVIVSDGGSTDETVEVLKKYPQVQWWSERDAGFVDAVTKGLAAATGEFVAIQSSDDFYLEGAFVKAIAVLRQEPDLLFVTGNDMIIQADGQVLYPPPKPYVTLLSPGGLIGRSIALYVPQHCTFIRRSAVDRVGGLRADVDMCADFDLWYRLLHFGHALLLPDYLAAYQMHAAQRTQSKAELFIASQKKVVEDAEANPEYAQRFMPTPEMKRRIFLQWEIGWNRSAGGDEGLRKSRAIASEALQQPDEWPDYILDLLKENSREPSAPSPVKPSPVKSLASRLHLSLTQNPKIRAVFGKPPVLENTAAAPNQTHNVDWWKDKP